MTPTDIEKIAEKVGIACVIEIRGTEKCDGLQMRRIIERHVEEALRRALGVV